MRSDIVEDLTITGDSFLATQLAVPGNKKSVFVEGRKLCQCGAPFGNRRLVIEGDRVYPAEEKVAGVHDILLGDAHDNVRARMSRMRLQDSGQPAQVDVHGQLRGVDRMIGQRQDAGVGKLEESGSDVEISVGVL